MIKPIQGWAIVDKRDNRLRTTWIIPLVEKAFFKLNENEEFIRVLITPIAQNTPQKRNKSDEKKRVQKKVPEGVTIIYKEKKAELLQAIKEYKVKKSKSRTTLKATKESRQPSARG